MADAALDVGAVVRVLAPFDGAYPDTYTVAEVITHEDGQVACLLDGVESAFAPQFLAPAEV
jgi:hypothetical protein